MTTVIRRDLITQTIIEFKVDLINHPYFLTINIWDIHSKIKAKIRKIRLINTYDVIISPETVYQGEYIYIKRAIEDINWNIILRGRAILLRDFNAYNPAWNPLITTRIRAGPLEQIIEDYDLILNNESGVIIKSKKN